MRAAILVPILIFAGCGDTLNPYAVEKPLHVPRMRLLTPATAAEPVDATYTIRAEFEKIKVTDTWTLSYISDSMPTLGADIGTDLPVTARTIEWDTAAMEPGLYYIYGRLKSLNGTFTVTAAGSLRIEHPVTTGNAPPSVTLVQPNGGEVLARGADATIAWTATDADGDPLTHELEISRDGGSTWTDLASGVTSPYTWAVPADQPVGLSYRIRVVSSDTPHAAKSSDRSAGTFTVR